MCEIELLAGSIKASAEAAIKGHFLRWQTEKLVNAGWITFKFDVVIL